MRTVRVPIALVASLALACGGAAADDDPDGPAPAAAEEAAPASHPVVIETPDVLRGLVQDAPGAPRPAVVPCATCHDDERREGDHPLPDTAVGISGPHAGLAVSHGDIRCASCHHATNRSALHLADGTELPLTEAMQLCRQCHGPQSRDYDHGSHGGMRGYWDLTRGPRVRNHCVSCHDPHDPEFGRYSPMPGPRDRFLNGAHDEDAEDHGEPADDEADDAHESDGEADE